MSHYIAYLDVLGVRNSSEREDFENYLRLIKNFQTELLRILEYVEDGRVHFFSDCAFLESRDLDSLVLAIKELRGNLFDSDRPIFIRGSISTGILGAINGFESKEFIDQYYDSDKTLMDFYKRSSPLIEKYKDKIRGTLFLSRDIAKIVQYESLLKGASIFIDEHLLNELDFGQDFVVSGYLTSVKPKEYHSFYDLSYDSERVTTSFVEKLFRVYYEANAYDLNYGRYYLSVLISCLNSISFASLDYDSETEQFTMLTADYEQRIEAHPLFQKILNLRLGFKDFYNYATGLEYVYFTLINKVYSDIGENNHVTKHFIRTIMSNKKYLGFYRNKISRIPRGLVDSRVKGLLIKDLMD